MSLFGLIRDVNFLYRVSFEMTEIVPVLLAGGWGTRLWPLSRKSYPKQFSNLIGDKSLFQQSALRLTSLETVKFMPHITMTNTKYRFSVGEQLQGVGIEPGPMLIEPESRNTAPAILTASIYAFERNEEADLLVTDTEGYNYSMLRSMQALLIAEKIKKIKSEVVVNGKNNPFENVENYEHFFDDLLQPHFEKVASGWTELEEGKHQAVPSDYFFKDVMYVFRPVQAR